MTSGGHAPGSAVVGVTVSMTILAGLNVISRLFTRLKIVRKAGLDDICITLALLLSVALTITMCEQVNYGMGRHFHTLTIHDKTVSFQWFWASVWIYYLGLCFTKLSILLQYLRVFPLNGFRIASFILMGIIIAYSLGTFFASIFACTPVARFWNPTLPGTCVDLTAVWFANTGINIVTDICTAVLPLPVLKSLQLPKRQKYALMAVFALGGFTCVISILRLQSLYVVSHTSDISWNNPLAAIWSSVELNVGIICSCLPTLKGIVQRYFPHLFPSTNLGESSNRCRVEGPARSARRRSQASFNSMGHELSGREKSTANTQIWAGDSHGTVEAYQRSESGYDRIAVQTILGRDIGKRDNKAASAESESDRRLTPIAFTRQMV